MKPFAVKCEDQRVPYKYVTNLQRPQNAGAGKRQECHGEVNNVGPKVARISPNAVRRGIHATFRPNKSSRGQSYTKVAQ